MLTSYCIKASGSSCHMSQRLIIHSKIAWPRQRKETHIPHIGLGWRMNFCEQGYNYPYELAITIIILYRKRPPPKFQCHGKKIYAALSFLLAGWLCWIQLGLLLFSGSAGVWLICAGLLLCSSYRSVWLCCFHISLGGASDERETLWRNSCQLQRCGKTSENTQGLLRSCLATEILSFLPDHKRKLDYT
jgi:hypothetical protein